MNEDERRSTVTVQKLGVLKNLRHGSVFQVTDELGKGTHPPVLAIESKEIPGILKQFALKIYGEASASHMQLILKMDATQKILRLFRIPVIKQEFVYIDGDKIGSLAENLKTKFAAVITSNTQHRLSEADDATKSAIRGIDVETLKKQTEKIARATAKLGFIVPCDAYVICITHDSKTIVAILDLEDVYRPTGTINILNSNLDHAQIAATYPEEAIAPLPPARVEEVSREPYGKFSFQD